METCHALLPSLVSTRVLHLFVLIQVFEHVHQSILAHHLQQGTLVSKAMLFLVCLDATVSVVFQIVLEVVFVANL